MDALTLELLLDSIRTMLGPREHEYSIVIVPLEHLDQQSGLLPLLDRVDGLLDTFDRRGRGSGIDAHRIGESGLDDLEDLRRHGRREEQILSLLGDERDDAAHVGPETHVEHAVGLIENEDVHSRKVDDAAVVQVEQTTRTGHKHLNTFAKARYLGCIAHTAVHDRAAMPAETRRLAGDLIDLDSKLSRRSDDECPNAAARGNPAERGQHERSRLARARLGTTDYVATGEYMRNRLALDFRGAGIAHCLHAAKNPRLEAECIERHMVLLL